MDPLISSGHPCSSTAIRSSAVLPLGNEDASCKGVLLAGNAGDLYMRRRSDSAEQQDKYANSGDNRQLSTSESCLPLVTSVACPSGDNSVRVCRAETNAANGLSHIKKIGCSEENGCISRSPKKQQRMDMVNETEQLEEQQALKVFFQQVPLTDLRNLESLVRGDSPPGGDFPLTSDQIADTPCGDANRQYDHHSMESASTEASSTRRSLDDHNRTSTSCLRSTTQSSASTTDGALAIQLESITSTTHQQQTSSPRAALWGFERVGWVDTKGLSSYDEDAPFNQQTALASSCYSDGGGGSSRSVVVSSNDHHALLSPSQVTINYGGTAAGQQRSEPKCPESSQGHGLSPVGAALCRPVLSPRGTKAFWAGSSPAQLSNVARVTRSPRSSGLLSSLSPSTLESLRSAVVKPCDSGKANSSAKRKIPDPLFLGLPTPLLRESSGHRLRPSDPDVVLADIEALTSMSTAPPISPSPASSMATTSLGSFDFLSTPFGCDGADWSRTARSFVDPVLELTTGKKSTRFQSSGCFVFNSSDASEGCLEASDIVVDDGATNSSLNKSLQINNEGSCIPQSLHSGAASIADEGLVRPVSSRDPVESSLPSRNAGDTAREGGVSGPSPQRTDDDIVFQPQGVCGESSLTSSGDAAGIGPLPDTLEDILRSLMVWDMGETGSAERGPSDRDASLLLTASPKAAGDFDQSRFLEIDDRQVESDSCGARGSLLDKSTSGGLVRSPFPDVPTSCFERSSLLSATASSIALAPTPGVRSLELDALSGAEVSSSLSPSDDASARGSLPGRKLGLGGRSCRLGSGPQKMLDNTDCSCRLCGRPGTGGTESLLGLGGATGSCGFNANNSMGLFPGPGGRHFGAPVVLAHPVEFKNPSSFLKVYGDPLCTAAANGMVESAGGGLNGNWDCQRCGNINYPRRFRCNKCNEVRGSRGDAVVSAYAAAVYLQHLQTYRRLGFGDAATSSVSQGIQKPSAGAVVCSVGAPVGGSTPTAPGSSGATRRPSNRAPRSANWAPSRRTTRPPASKLASLVSLASLSPVVGATRTPTSLPVLSSQQLPQSGVLSSVDIESTEPQALQSLGLPPPLGGVKSTTRVGFRNQLPSALSPSIKASATWS